MDETTKFILHDIRNRLFQASSCLDIAGLESADIADNPWLQKTTNALIRASELIDQLSPLLQQSESEWAIDHGQQRWQLKDYIEQHSRHDFQNLSQQFDINIEVQCKLLPEDRWVLLNDAKIKRVKENLIENAVKANAKNLMVHYEMFPNYYTVTCIDDGEGMNKEQLDKLMLRLFAEDQIHGLGTQFIMATAEEHNFVVTYQSELGKGTSVRFLCRYCL